MNRARGSALSQAGREACRMIHSVTRHPLSLLVLFDYQEIRAAQTLTRKVGSLPGCVAQLPPLSSSHEISLQPMSL